MLTHAAPPLFGSFPNPACVPRSISAPTQTFAPAAPIIPQMSLSPEVQLGLWVFASAASLWFVWRSGVFSFAAGAGKGAGKGKSKGKRAPGGGVFTRDVSALPAAIWFVCAAATYLSIPVGAGLSASIPPEHRGPNGSLQLAAVTNFVAFSTAAMLGLVMLYLVQARTPESAGTRFAPRDIALGAWCFLLAAPLVALTALGAKWFWTNALGSPPPDIAHEGLKLFLSDPLSVWGLLFALTASIVTPIAEELIYRVFGQSSARALMGDTPGRVWISVLFVSAVFAFSHAAGGGPVPWAAVPGLLMLAIAMGIAYERTRRPGVPITMHALFNAANLLMAWWSTQGT